MPPQSQDQVNSRDSGAAIQALPNRLDSLRWILIGGIRRALFVLGVMILWRQPAAMLVQGWREKRRLRLLRGVAAWRQRPAQRP